MLEEWRLLLYPLGFLSNFLFGARFIVQWLQSERQGKSVVTHLFWKLSLSAHFLLALHTYIQFQYLICLIQTCHAIISWRNINLMQSTHLSAFSRQKTIYLFIFAGIAISFAFLLQNLFFMEYWESWLRIPVTPWQTDTGKTISWVGHLAGMIGYLLFSSRFWIQWWLAEKAQQSCLPPSFWWLSLIGALMSLIYFILIGDIVNGIGPLLGIVPYIRNLMLIYKVKQLSTSI